MSEKVKLWLIVWTIGLWGGIFVWLLIAAGVIKLKGYRADKFNSGDKGLILISNHPSLFEPAILPFLFLFSPRSYLFHLDKIPYSTPDKENYYDKSWFFFLRPVCVPIERKKRREELKAMDWFRTIVQNGGVLILFAEATRTWKGGEKRGYRYSLSGEPIARFPLGIRRLVHGLDCKVLSVWTKGGEKIIPNEWNFPDAYKFLAAPFRLPKGMEIIIGEPFESKSLPQNKRRIAGELEKRLLEVSEF